jgi:hypothetical protein
VGARSTIAIAGVIPLVAAIAGLAALRSRRGAPAADAKPAGARPA